MTGDDRLVVQLAGESLVACVLFSVDPDNHPGDIHMQIAVGPPVAVNLADLAEGLQIAAERLPAELTAAWARRNGQGGDGP